MNVVTKALLLLFLVFGGVSLPVAAQDGAVSENPLIGNCSDAQRIANRAWSMYIAKNAVSDDDTIANGARLQGLSSLLSYCMVPGPDGKPKLNLSSLDTEEMMQYTTFVPDGPMSDLAKCLVDSAPNEASAFIVAADRLAVSKYLAEKSFGAFPDDAFVKMVEASDGCGDLLNEPVKAVMLYTDINWFVRVVTKHDDIIAWHKQAGGS